MNETMNESKAIPERKGLTFSFEDIMVTHTIQSTRCVQSNNIFSLKNARILMPPKK